MKIMFYALRPFDEQQYCEPYKARYGIDYTGTPDVPRPDNLHLAEAATPSARTPARYALNICRHGLKWASNICPAAASAMIISRWTPPKSWVCASATAITRRTAWPTIRSCSC